MTATTGSIWYEVHYSEWSPRIEERIVVKETAQMVEYQIQNYNWNTKKYNISTIRARKISDGREWYSQLENAKDALKHWAERLRDSHVKAAQRLTDAIEDIKIVPIERPAVEVENTTAGGSDD